MRKRAIQINARFLSLEKRVCKMRWESIRRAQLKKETRGQVYEEAGVVGSWFRSGCNVRTSFQVKVDEGDERFEKRASSFRSGR